MGLFDFLKGGGSTGYPPRYDDIGISYVREKNGQIIIKYRNGSQKICGKEEIKFCNKCGKNTPIYEWYDAGAYNPHTRDLCMKCGNEY